MPFRIADLDDRRDEQERPGLDAVQSNHFFLTRTITESSEEK